MLFLTVFKCIMILFITDKLIWIVILTTTTSECTDTVVKYIHTIWSKFYSTVFFKIMVS